MSGQGDPTGLTSSFGLLMLLVFMCLAAAYVAVTVINGWKRYSKTYVARTDVHILLIPMHTHVRSDAHVCGGCVCVHICLYCSLATSCARAQPGVK